MFVYRLSVGVAAGQVLEQSGNRLSVAFVNRGGADIYLGRDATVSALTGLTVKPGDFFSFASDFDEYWAIAAAPATALEIVEVLGFLPSQLAQTEGGREL